MKYHFRVFSSDFRRCVYDLESADLHSFDKAFNDWFYEKHRKLTMNCLFWNNRNLIFEGTLEEFRNHIFNLEIIL